MKARVALLLLAVSSMAACEGWAFDGLTQEERVALKAPSLPFETVALGQHGIDEPATAVIRTFEDEARLFRRLKEDASRLPRLDLTQETGIFVLFPVRPSIADRGQIVAVEQRPEGLKVHTVLFEKTGLMPMMVGRSWHYIAIRKTPSPVTFAPTVHTADTNRPTGLPIPEPRLASPTADR